MIVLGVGRQKGESLEFSSVVVVDRGGGDSSSLSR